MRPVVTALLLATALFVLRPGLADVDQTASAQDAQGAGIRKQLSELHWIHGPKHVELFGNSALDLPAGYMFLNPDDTAKLQAITHNLGGATQYFLAPEDFHWEAFFSFRDDGYVKDDEQIDAASLLDNIKQNTVEGNKLRRERGWDEVAVTGWQTPPHYDPQTKRLEWAVAGKDVKTNDNIVNFNTRILGRGGVMSAVLISGPDTLTGSISELESALTGFEYLPGQRYAEYKPGDKIAKYGLAALITGGAAAIAVKTGFWKVIVSAAIAGWKFILAGFVAVSAGIAKRFKRKYA